MQDINKEFYEILSPKDCGGYSKTAKSAYEDAVSRMDCTLKNIENKLNNSEYTKYQPEVDNKILAYYESIIASFKTALQNFVTNGSWDFVAPSASQETKDKFNTFMDAVNKHGGFFDGRIDRVDDLFKRVTKNLIKNNFSASALAQKKAAEEEAKKPKMPETTEYARFETYDPNRMKEYKPNSRGESMAHSSYLMNRNRQFAHARQYPQYLEITEYLNRVFNALDSAWFAFVSGKPLDFSEADQIYKDYTSKYSTVKQFDNKVCTSRMVNGGSFTFWDCKNALDKMANNRNKLIKTLTMEQEDTYSLWEKSVDAILDESGKPALNTYLDNWVNEVTAYYTDEKNIESWKEIDAKLAKEIKELEEQMNQIALTWSEEHAKDRTMTWYELHNGYKKLPEYEELKYRRDSKNSVKQSNAKDLSIANLGEEKIRKLFQEQAAEAKKSFITAVCERTGVLKDGNFYWSVDNTGHLNGTVTGVDGRKWRITSFWAGGYNIQRLHSRTKITKLK